MHCEIVCCRKGNHTFVWTMQNFLGMVHTVPIEFHTCPIRPCALLPLTFQDIRCTLDQRFNSSALSVNMTPTYLRLICVDLQVFDQVVHRVEGSPTPQPQTTLLSQSRECQVDDSLKFRVLEMNGMSKTKPARLILRTNLPHLPLVSVPSLCP